MRIAILATAVCGLIWACTACGEDPVAPGKDKPAATTQAGNGALDRLPEAVRKTALKEAGDHKITGIEKEVKDGKTLYEVEWMIGDKETEIQIAEDGTVVDRKVTQRAAQPRPMTRQAIRDDMKRVLELSAEQAAKIKAIDESCDKDAAKWATDNAKKIADVNKAFAAAMHKGDVRALVQAHNDMVALQAPYNAIFTKAGADVLAVLSNDQKAKWQRHAVMKSIDVWFERSKLTDEQKTAVKTAYDELAKKEGATCDTIMVALAEKIRDMLTKEQLSGIGVFGMKMEKSIRLPESGPATATAPAEQRTTVENGMLMLTGGKLPKDITLFIGGGYPGIMGAGGGGNTISTTESGEGD